jgi:glycosyltransferase involved in cell wall biosynthesis
MAHQVAVYQRASAVLALSSREAGAYRRLEVDGERIFQVPMGIDLPPPGLLDPERGVAFRRTRGITGALVAFLGANTYDKGAFSLLLAVSELIRQGTALDVVFAGPNHEKLEAFMASLPVEARGRLDGRVHLLGLVDEPTKHAILSACDMLALPSQVDAFGIVFLEAWLHGKPVIGANAGGIPDLVREGETGLLVPFGDVLVLAEAVSKLAADPALRQGLGNAGRERVLRYYTWDRTYTQLEEVHAAALAAPHG